MRLIEEHEKAFEIVMTGTDCFITGGGGVGKSHLLRTIVNAFKKKGKQVVVTAPTGAAAVLIKGSTIHRTFGIPSGACINEKTLKIMTRTTEALRKADVVIIDEISMVRMDLFDAIFASLKKAEEKSGIHKQLIVFGDFFQLPPVLTETHGERKLLEKFYGCEVGHAFAFQSNSWKNIGFYPIELTEVVRQSDKKTIENLNLARKGNKACINFFNSESSTEGFIDGITVTGSKQSANSENKQELKKIQAPSVVYNCSVSGAVENSDFVIDPQIELKIGALVTTVINHPDSYFVNGSIGKITELTEDHIAVKFPTFYRPISIARHRWDVYDYSTDENGIIHKDIIGSYEQFPVRLAYATTIHKSQGATYDEINLDPFSWAPGQLYVALSRMKKIKKLYLKSNIREEYLIADEVVKDFYDHLLDNIPVIKKSIGRPKQATGSTVVKRVPSELSDQIENAIKVWNDMGSNRYNYELSFVPTGMKDTLDLFVERATSGSGDIEYINDPDDSSS